MMFTPPLSREDAETIAHAAEVRILEATIDRPNLHDDTPAYRYGEARRWLCELMQGRPIEIDEAELANSRRIMTHSFR